MTQIALPGETILRNVSVDKSCNSTSCINELWLNGNEQEIVTGRESLRKEEREKKMLAFPNEWVPKRNCSSDSGEDTKTEQYFRNPVPRIQATSQFGLWRYIQYCFNNYRIYAKESWIIYFSIKKIISNRNEFKLIFLCPFLFSRDLDLEKIEENYSENCFPRIKY